MVIDLSQSPTYVGTFVLPPWFTVCVTAVGGKVGDRFGETLSSSGCFIILLAGWQTF